MLGRICGSGLTMASTTASVATLQRMSAQTLSEKILAEREAADPTFAVVDVRDDGRCPLRPFRDTRPWHHHFYSDEPDADARRLPWRPHQGLDQRAQ